MGLKDCAQESVSPSPEGHATESAVDPGTNLVPGFEVHSLPSSRKAANEAMFRWRWMASLVFAAALGAWAWSLWGNPASSDAASLAANATKEIPTQSVTLVSEGSGNEAMVRDPQLDALLAAHQQLGGVSGLQMPSGFLRNATFERPTR